MRNTISIVGPVRLISAFLLASLLICGITALAGPLDIEASYGNRGGCAYLKTGRVTGDDDLYLTAEEYGSYATLCEFVQASPTRHGGLVTTVLCGHEGDGYQTIEMNRIEFGNGGREVAIFDEQGNEWARLQRCR